MNTMGKKERTTCRKTLAEETSEGRKVCLGRTAFKREDCGVFTPCKECNIETRSGNYATVDEAVFLRAMLSLASLVAKQQL
jgi:hypothetical protein